MSNVAHLPVENSGYQPDIFRKRTTMRPQEYPDLARYKDAIRHSYWIHTEWKSEFNTDVQDYRTALTHEEREVARKTMLAIAQVEVSVKEFWGDIYKYMPKPEIGDVGYTFAESEVRHSDAYAFLIELLGLNGDFETLSEVPAIADRIDYLSEYIAGYKNKESGLRSYSMTVMLFSIFIEHVSLFSQFLIMMSFSRQRGLLKGISNAVEATSKEEQIHGNFGIRLIQIIRQENPEWFGPEFDEMVTKACHKAFKAENKILNWIYSEGDLDFMPRATVEEFLKERFNQSMEAVKVEPIFEVDQEAIESTMWFDEEILGASDKDFFDTRPVSYSKNMQSFTEKDLF